MQHPKVEMCPVSSLRPYANNARTHSKSQVEQIARSIERFGFTNPILTDDDDGITTRAEEQAMHPTVKPVAMIADAMRDCSNRGDIALDVFGGSGSTLIAAQECGRKARLLELDPIYCDTTIRRFEKVAGLKAVLAEDRTTFSEVTTRRQAQVHPGSSGNEYAA